ncbi:MAG: TIGR03936 family radical SAM-associated protein, partial [Hungatella sp.]
MKIRIKFSKLGAMKFVGHLDLLRYFQKAMRRAEVDICYSEGFSPHQVMSFAAPLGVGLTGTGEYMDIEVHSTKDSKTMIRQLNAVMVDGIQILSYRKLEDDSKNAMSLVMAADYTISFYEQKKPQDPDEFFREMKRFYDQEQILIEKKTKKSEKEVNIKPLILELHR